MSSYMFVVLKVNYRFVAPISSRHLRKLAIIYVYFSSVKSVVYIQIEIKSRI